MKIRELAKDIRRMLVVSPKKREEILEKAKQDLSEETRKKIPGIVLNLSYDKSVYMLAGLDYAQGLPNETPGVFTTAVTNYFLRKN